MYFVSCSIFGSNHVESLLLSPSIYVTFTDCCPHVFSFSIVLQITTPPPSPTQVEIPSDGTSRKTRQATWLRRLTARTLDQPRVTVNVNPATGRGLGPHKDKFHSYLRVVARDKIPILHSTWNNVPETLKNMIWDDILDPKKPVNSPLKTVEEEKASVVVDPLGELVKNLFDIYQRPKKPNAAIKGAVHSTVKSVSKNAEGKPPQHGPQWIEVKSHAQTGNYECGYYVMHWIRCIVSARLKDEWISVCLLLFI
ncbi:hypothetical protein JHK84_047873 [Glycine max]|uniref:Ubiquitin-like protease family profile domain-containing protein n=1 Tax=Glycine soja TaxID=3848 RepID=A0A0B2RDG6_GLYSO|nr:hypothetical protein JHK86_047850 [Glycine max]KAG4943816.1 hypothetical protein JHK85_048462 [Glycine max]KAG5102904.1 hypothetical protein JHK84_047873 [Glycine max]KHN29897.1 hypothetical protein glysoja_049967 [Glycine soja]